MTQEKQAESSVYNCFDCKKTFRAEEIKFEKIAPNFNVIGGMAAGSEAQACPHCGAIAFFGFALHKEG